ncbi:hypothetical protein [Telluribacter humicola]|uniref:hypothetical protein n=1 Tax=Telluribacter humicola TaxID=1720261 RepID=UPI001A9656F6|nr:hypothetical protein [Telluribacter humicola]
MDVSQFISVFNPLKNFNNLRYSVGIYMLFNGFPIIFFVRDTLGIGPASSVFTAAFWMLGLVLMLPAQLFMRIYKPNAILFNLSVLFLLLAFFYYMLPGSTGAGTVTEFGNYFFIFAYLILIIQVPNTVKDTLIPVIFILSLLSNFSLIYSLLVDPNWTLGMRAAITFANENAQSGGNPHAAARNAIVCIISSGVLIWQSRSLLLKTFFYFCIIFSVVIIILTQTKSTFLALILMLMFYIYANFSMRKIGSAIYNFFSLKTVLIAIFIFLVANYFLSRYYDIYAIILNYSDVLFARFYNVYYTITGVQIDAEATIDASSMGRVSSFELFFESIDNPQIMLFGLGYKATFLDVPVLEALINHGLLGFLFFDGFLFFLLVYTHKEVLRKTNIIALFVAYLYIYTIPQMVTGGRPYDITYWFSFILMVRFLGIKYLDAAPKQRTLATATA